ncbi:probable peptidoglycan muropeptide transporter SLC46 [Culicoides brevitarsis]|uniref:probable peptidoglycan muropeptide transporter SLC46 n=1 Tax=Culicoides brevitarsis TaxID=469753 RepID=UPI00307BC016
MEKQPSLDEKQLSRVQKLLKNRKLILEPVVAILFFAIFLSAQVITNHITYRACRSELGESEEICRQLERKDGGMSSKDLETRVQPFVATYQSYKVVIESLVPALMSLFVGAWSDKHGRKKVIFVAYSGFALQFLIFYLLGTISSAISYSWYLLASLPIAVTGGNCILMSTLMSYMADISTAEQRAKRVASFQIGLIIGVFMGSGFSGLLNKTLGAVNLFFVSFVVLLFGFLYIFFRVPESIEVSSKHRASGLKDLFKTDMIKEMAHSAFRPRKNHDRLIVWLIIANFAITMFQQEGSQGLTFLYTREKFGWTLEDFSVLVIIATLLIIVGSQTGLALQKKLEWSDTKTGIFSTLSLVFSNFLNAQSTQSWHLYAAMFLGIFRALPDTLNRSILASVVASNEIGKINSLIGSIQAICSLVGSPTYTWIYRQTIETNPGFYHYVTGCFFCLIALSFGVIQLLQNEESVKKEKKMDKKVR